MAVDEATLVVETTAQKRTVKMCIKVHNAYMLQMCTALNEEDHFQEQHINSLGNKHTAIKKDFLIWQRHGENEMLVKDKTCVESTI